MKALRYFVLFLMLIIGLYAFTRPGSYYPPPANVIYHNDTLTICPPDSLPGEPVILMSYNIYVDSAFFDNVPVSDPTDTINYIFTFPALPPGDHSICAKAVYNQWISEQACDSAQVIYGYELPFLEDWSSGSFEELQWIPSSGNWVISNGEGNPAPAAEFRGDPTQTNYSISLESFPINASELIEGKIWLDFDLKLDCINPTGDEILQVQVWNWTHKVWTTVAEYYNDEGSFTWPSEHVNIKAQAMKKVFKVRFQATGTNSSNIQGWFVDNIHLYRMCNGALSLFIEEQLDYNILHWQPPTGCYDEWLHWDNGFNSGQSIGTGESVEFDVAARWEPAQLPDFPELYIWQVDFFPAESQAIYHVRIWTGTGPDTMIIDQLVNTPEIGEWNRVTLEHPVPLDITKDLWVGYHVNTPTGYPAGVDNGPGIDGYGNMICFDGAWQTLLELNPDLNFNWNIQCHLSWYLYLNHDFNIYRKTNDEEFQLINTIKDDIYLDTNVYLPNYYCYKITMLWINDSDTCESDPTNTVCETVNVGINQPEQNNTIKIYPIPTKNWLNIEAGEEIREIRVYDLLGDEILKLEIGNLGYRLDVSNLPGGIYYVMVETEGREFKEKVVILR
jgi:hypothetical protein